MFASSDVALDWMRDVTQDLLYTTQDYSELRADAGYYGENRETILPLLSELDLNKTRAPQRNNYDFMLVCGGSQEWCAMRVRHAKTLLQQGVGCGNVVLHGSNRLLMPELEQDSIVKLLGPQLSCGEKELKESIRQTVEDPILGEIKDIYERNTAQTKMILETNGLKFSQWPTEAEMLELFYEEMRRELPDNAASIPCSTIYSPMIRRQDNFRVEEHTEETIQKLLNGELRRANTHDILCDFASSDISARGGSVLSLSHQPYALHQHGQLLSALPESRFSVLETATDNTPLEDVNVHHALGCIAKYIYAVHDRTHDKLAMQSTTRAFA